MNETDRYVALEYVVTMEDCGGSWHFSRTTSNWKSLRWLLDNGLIAADTSHPDPVSPDLVRYAVTPAGIAWRNKPDQPEV